MLIQNDTNLRHRVNNAKLAQPVDLRSAVSDLE